MIVIASVIGACIGVCLGALGGGGSIITVPALVYLLQQPLSTAITQSLVIVGISAVVAVAGHARAGHVRWRAGIALGAVGALAAWGGTAFGRLIPANTALASFSVLMLVVALSLLYRSKSRLTRSTSAAGPSHGRARSERGAPVRGAVEVVLAGVLIGGLTGFFGVGGGFVIVPVLVILLGYPMPVAVGTSLLVVSLNSATALLARIGHQPIEWSVVLPVTVVAILGSVVGKVISQRTSESVLTRSFAAMLLVVAGYVGARSFGLLP
ncbi:sulfite exporter TauE/SafE family protein [Nocardia sp. NPDC088792]|uniref:sulfite exporter TauE/SafE family protein n=1 Tax=Nocardia sp. NPDC088792 TaxID=3364332 RepID=UPI003807EC71